MPQIRFVCFSTFLFFFSFAALPLYARELRIAVAGSYLPVARSVGKDFEKTTPYRLHWISGSTGSLFVQIQNGAPFDAFLSADVEHPLRLIKEGLATPDSLFIYETGRLVLWTQNTHFPENAHNHSQKRYSNKTFDETFVLAKFLLQNKLLLSLPNPEIAPYGKAARAFLRREALWQKLRQKNRLVFSSGVNQSFFYVKSKVSDLGFISLRQLLSVPRPKRGFFYLVPENRHPPLLHAAVILREGKGIRSFWKHFAASPHRSISLRNKDLRNKEENKETQKGEEKNVSKAISSLLHLHKKTKEDNEDNLESRSIQKEFLKKEDLKALFLSLRLAALTSLILLFVATPLAWMLSLLHWPSWIRWMQFFLDGLVTLPLVLPPTVLGFYLLLLLGKQGPLGEAALAFGFWGILAGSCIYSLPFAVQPLRDAFANIGRLPIDAAASCGAAPLDRFFSIVLPMSRSGYLSAAVLSFAHTLGEFGVVLMLGGSIPGKTRLASIAIFEHVEAMHYRQAHALALCLLGISLALLLTLYAIRGFVKKKTGETSAP